MSAEGALLQLARSRLPTDESEHVEPPLRLGIVFTTARPASRVLDVAILGVFSAAIEVHRSSDVWIPRRFSMCPSDADASLPAVVATPPTLLFRDLTAHGRSLMLHLDDLSPVERLPRLECGRESPAAIAAHGSDSKFRGISCRMLQEPVWDKQLGDGVDRFKTRRIAMIRARWLSYGERGQGAGTSGAHAKESVG